MEKRVMISKNENDALDLNIETNHMSPWKLLKASKGFSLIEILVALTLLGIAGTFVAGRIFESLNEGKINSAKIQMQNLAARLEDFRRKCYFYPTTEQGLYALSEKPTAGRECKNYPPGGFIKDGLIPKDPWDEDYVYESDGKQFNIYSLGQDATEGGEGADADIYFKETKNQQEEAQ